jgi:hypothetical protein
MAGRRLPDGPAAGPARLHPGNGRVLRPGQPGPAARLKARETDRRKDWAEQTSTGIARRFDLIRVEDLKITNMTRSAKGTRENPAAMSGRKPG